MKLVIPDTPERINKLIQLAGLNEQLNVGRKTGDKNDLLIFNSGGTLLYVETGADATDTDGLPFADGAFFTMPADHLTEYSFVSVGGPGEVRLLAH